MSLYFSPSAIDDIPSSPILLSLKYSSCSEQLTFNNLLRQLPPVMEIVSEAYKS